MRTFLLLLGICLLTQWGQAQTDANAQTGYASYYAGYLHGNRTAYGEIYDQNKLTAAPSYIIRLGTQANEVTRLDNGKSIIVRVNDRGPSKQSRIIDISYAAAEAIDLVYDWHCHG